MTRFSDTIASAAMLAGWTIQYTLHELPYFTKGDLAVWPTVDGLAICKNLKTGDSRSHGTLVGALGIEGGSQ